MCIRDSYAGQGDVVGLAGDGFHALLVEGDADHDGIGAQAGEQLVVVAAAVAQASPGIVEGDQRHHHGVELLGIDGLEPVALQRFAGKAAQGRAKEPRCGRVQLLARHAVESLSLIHI